MTLKSRSNSRLELCPLSARHNLRELKSNSEYIWPSAHHRWNTLPHPGRAVPPVLLGLWLRYDIRLFSTINPEGAMFATGKENVNRTCLLKDNYPMVILRECHWCHPFETIRDKYCVERAAKYVCIHYAFPVDGKLFSPSQVIKISEIANISIESDITTRGNLHRYDWMSDELSASVQKRLWRLLRQRAHNGHLVKHDDLNRSCLPTLERPTYATL